MKRLRNILIIAILNSGLIYLELLRRVNFFVRLVGSVKIALKKVFKNAKLPINELNTVIVVVRCNQVAVDF